MFTDILETLKPEEWDSYGNRGWNAMQKQCPAAFEFWQGVASVVGEEVAKHLLVDFELQMHDFLFRVVPDDANSKNLEEIRLTHYKNRKERAAARGAVVAPPTPEKLVRDTFGTRSRRRPGEDGYSSSAPMTPPPLPSTPHPDDIQSPAPDAEAVENNTEAASAQSSSQSDWANLPSMVQNRVGILTTSTSTTSNGITNGVKRGLDSGMANGTGSPSKKQKTISGMETGHCTGVLRKGVVAQTIELPSEVYGYGDRDIVYSGKIGERNLTVLDTDGRLLPIGHNGNLAICLFTLFQKNHALRGHDDEDHLPLAAVLWELFLTCDNASVAMEKIQKFKMMCGGSLMLTDRETAIHTEFDSNHWEVQNLSGENDKHKDTSPILPCGSILRTNHGLLGGCKFDAKSDKVGDGNTIGSRAESQARLQFADKNAKADEDEKISVGDILDGEMILKTGVLSRIAIDLSDKPENAKVCVEFKERYPCIQKQPKRPRGKAAAKAKRDGTMPPLDVIKRLLTGTLRVHKVKRKARVYQSNAATESGAFGIE